MVLGSFLLLDWGTKKPAVLPWRVHQCRCLLNALRGLLGCVERWSFCDSGECCFFPAFGVPEAFGEQRVGELGHGHTSPLGLVKESGDEESTNDRAVVHGSGHDGVLFSLEVHPEGLLLGFRVLYQKFERQLIALYYYSKSTVRLKWFTPYLSSRS